MTRYPLLSLGAALVTLALKLGAWRLTGSVGLLSDAAESVVNLAAALFALAMLALAARPADAEHAYGHSKAEYFSSGLEGALILVAAAAIVAAAWPRLLHPQRLESVGLGLLVSASASVINLAVARVLGDAGRKHRSVTLEADGQHLMTDVWTSVAVLVGVGSVALTGWTVLDPLLAMIVALHIVATGVRMTWRSAMGLLDVAWPARDQAVLTGILSAYQGRGVKFHAVRTRQAGQRRFVSMHILVPGDWSVQHGHELLERIEAEVRAALPGASVLTHLEPIEDPVSFEDTDLDRS